MRSRFLSALLPLLLAAALPAPAAAESPAGDPPPAELLSNALSYTRSAKGKRIKATIERDGKTTTVEVQVSGRDFDLQTKPATRQLRSVGTQNWVSEDGGKTWKSTSREDATVALLLGTLTVAGGSTVEKTGENRESNGAETERVVHLRVRAAGAAAETEAANYWIGWSQSKKPLLRRFQGSVGGAKIEARFGWINATPAVEAPK